MEFSKKDTKDKRDTIAAGVFIVSIFISIPFGLHNDWTTYALFIPFGWGLLGLAVDWLINGKESTRETIGVSVCCMLIIVNMVTIIIHRDTPFIIGRIICSIGATIGIIRGAMNCYEVARKKDVREIKRLEQQVEELTEQIRLLTHA